MIIGVIGTAIRMYFINLEASPGEHGAHGTGPQYAEYDDVRYSQARFSTSRSMYRACKSYLTLKPLRSPVQAPVPNQRAKMPTLMQTPRPEEPVSPTRTRVPMAHQATADNAANSSGTKAASSPPPEPPQNRPKFIGTNKEIAVDVSRLPRLDQYHPILHMSSSGEYTSLPTDVKSVSYFVSLDANGFIACTRRAFIAREVDRATMRDEGEAENFSVDAAAKQIGSGNRRTCVSIF